METKHIPSTYEKRKEYLRNYRRERYANDEEFRNKIKDKVNTSYVIKYATDDEYREKKMQYSRDRFKMLKTEQSILTT